MRLATLAWVAFVTHVAAALGSLFLLREGTPTGPDMHMRMAYVDANLLAWRLGWLGWTIASLSLVALLFGLDRRAAWAAAVALLFDLPAQWVLATPAWSLESTAYFSTGVIANALYTLALAQAAWRAILPRALRWAAVPAVLAGAAVSIASALMHPTALFWSTGILTAAMIAWTFALGVWAWRAA